MDGWKDGEVDVWQVHQEKKNYRKESLFFAQTWWRLYGRDFVRELSRCWL